MTEMITGVDLIQEQIKAAQGDVLRFRQEDIKIKVRAPRCSQSVLQRKRLLAAAEPCRGVQQPPSQAVRSGPAALPARRGTRSSAASTRRTRSRTSGRGRGA